MTIKNIFILIFSLSLLLLIAGGCGSGGGGGSNTAIVTQQEADRAASAIKYAVLDAAPYFASGTTVWNNEIVSGYSSGTATVNGTFTKTNYGYFPEKTTYTYTNVTIIFNNFCNDVDLYPRITGSATINGSITYQSTYSGSWTIYASLTLAGKYTGTVTVALSVTNTGSSHSGILEVNGTQWTVNYPYSW